MLNRNVFRIVAALVLFSCFPADKQVEAAAGYEAQQLACVDRNPDRASIDACRAKVRKAWAPTDAGQDGGDQ